MRWKRWAVLSVLLALLGGAAAWTWQLDQAVRSQFEGKRWAVPATVYARPLELYVGLPLGEVELRTELGALDYRPQPEARGWGTWDRDGSTYLLGTRAFAFWDGNEPALRVRVRLSGGFVAELTDADSGEPLPLVRLDPARIGHIYPSHREDRLLVRLDEVPPTLVDALLAVEDGEFYEHVGLSPRGIARAALANVRARRIVQGGSTLTQQLVKNFFLSHDRTVARKLNEAVMALLLERRYDKDEILETYLNEVFLAQDGERSIHGFGLASHHLFGEPLENLDIDQQALLVALIRGPSFYHPRRHPERALNRRNLVLGLMQQHAIISAEQAEEAQQRPLGVVPERTRPRDSYPAFLDLAQRHLQRDYRPEDLQSEGLRIFTTLSPTAQAATETAVSRQLHSRTQGLEAAAVVADIASGEVLAVVGGREPRFAGFNRALDARRQIGSLVKPAVFLAALEQAENFGLGSILEDEPLIVEEGLREPWEPRNFDGQFQGDVLLVDALAQSRNLPAIRTGLQVGLPSVQYAMERLGVSLPQPLYPSHLIGTGELSVLEVTQMYQTLASGGFHTPLRAVRAVTRQDGTPLTRYALSTVRVFDPAPVHLVNTAMIAAMREGTGRGAYNFLEAETTVAGKTGTTDQGRDSWFAGFSGDLLGVVWLGRDDNGPTGLTGATGALPVWADALAALRPQSLTLLPPEGIEEVWVDRVSGLRAGADCNTARALPYVRGYGPQQWSGCGTMPSLPSIDNGDMLLPERLPPASAPGGASGERRDEERGGWLRRLFR